MCSIPPLETVLQATNRKSVAVELNDRPENDFNTLSLTITRWSDNLDRIKYPHEIFISLRPSSFYKRLSSSGVVDLGFCFTCLHFLENMPFYPDSHFIAVQSQETRELLQQQAHTDLQKFLQHRASEIVPRGQLLISFIASGFGHANFFSSGPGDSCRLALMDMVSAGLLSTDDMQAFTIPVYFRTLENIRSTLETKDTSNQWSVIAMEQSEILHPFWKELQQKKMHSIFVKDDSSEYAKAMVNWFLTVFEPFFVRSLTSNPTRTHEEVVSLVGELTTRAVLKFLEKYTDDPVYIQSIYLLLERRE